MGPYRPYLSGIIGLYEALLRVYRKDSSIRFCAMAPTKKPFSIPSEVAEDVYNLYSKCRSLITRGQPKPVIPFFIPKEVLKDLYTRMTVQAIAKLYHVDKTTIKRQLLNHKIKLHAQKTKFHVRKSIDKSLLKDLYIDKGMSLYEIKAYLQCGEVLLISEMKRHRIPINQGSGKNFIEGKPYGYKKLCELQEKKIKKIMIFCHSNKNSLGFNDNNYLKLLLLIDERI